MLAHSSKIYIENQEIDFTSGTLTKDGGNTASRLNFSIPGENTSMRKYWGKEVTFFLDASDAYPMFRGFIENVEVVENVGVNCRALDVLGYLTGLDRASVALDDYSNIDGESVGGGLKKLISLANLTQVGTDYIGETIPSQRVGKIRGTKFILDTITELLNTVYDTTNEDYPRKSFIKVFDDGNKGQLKIEVVADSENSKALMSFSYDNNMVAFNVRNKKIPTIVTVTGKQGHQATFKHQSAIEAYGEHTITLTNNQLESRAECLDFAQDIFLSHLKAHYEYALVATEGYYLEENDVIRIVDEETLVDGKFRVIGKTINFGVNELQLELRIDKQPPLLSRFLTT